MPDVRALHITQDDIYWAMDWTILKSNWALAVAAIIGFIIVMSVVAQRIRRSSWGQLRQALHTLAKARRYEAKALKSAKKAERVARGLHEIADRAKPRILQEAKDVLQDARALAIIANDKILVAENHVRLVIQQEYPPVRQEALQQKYLPDPARDKKPFSFE